MTAWINKTMAMVKRMKTSIQSKKLNENESIQNDNTEYNWAVGRNTK